MVEKPGYIHGLTDCPSAALRGILWGLHTIFHHAYPPTLPSGAFMARPPVVPNSHALDSMSLPALLSASWTEEAPDPSKVSTEGERSEGVTYEELPCY